MSINFPGQGPIALPPLPRQTGGSVANELTAQPNMAAVVDSNFAKVNSWADSYNTLLTVAGVTAANLFTLETGSWTGLVAYGMVVGSVRWMSIEAKWNVGDLFMSANSRGGLGNIKLGTIKDSRFIDTGYRKVVGGTSQGMCSFDFYPSGQVDLATLSYDGQMLSAGEYVSFNHCFIERA